MKETPVQQRIRLKAAQLGQQIWRNNVGACYDDTGRFIRYGLCNDSKQLNDRIKSSDLVGMTTIIVTPDMVGQTVGVFTAVETKASDWVFRPSDKRAVAQLAFHDIVTNAGGFAGFARNEEEYVRIIKNEKIGRAENP